MCFVNVKMCRESRPSDDIRMGTRQVMRKLLAWPLMSRTVTWVSPVKKIRWGMRGWGQGHI